VNDLWRQMAGAHAPATATEPGGHYLEFLDSAARTGESWASEAAAGLRAVLQGKQRDFRLEFVRPAAAGDRTFLLRAVPLDRPDGGAVLTYVDLTDQRHAELEAQQARAELAHVSRVATMGALTASIAHQLNQPLTGIMANAQAAQRFLAASSPDLQEVRTSLQDIMEDDRRASEVIVRMRELLRKDNVSPAEIEINGLVRDVVRLLTSDAIIRNVAVVLQLDDGPALVRGDRVQLEQVVLNLIVNALEALDARGARDRRVLVRSGRSGRRFVEVSISDNGPGFDGALASVFEAFFTTKPAGMGLGLSIARSVVEAHAGMIRAANNPEGGATVSFRLPLVRNDCA
jgi:C4-dicarboxylate-specific signal transduction histidine kinase